MVKKIKKQLRTPRGRWITFILLSGLFFLGWVNLELGMASRISDEKDIREIILEIRNMTFAGNNPTLYLKPGERVRFVIHNLDYGMKHNFWIEKVDVATRILDYDEKETLLFTAPNKEGEMDYVCSLHALMMQGRIVINQSLASSF